MLNLLPTRLPTQPNQTKPVTPALVTLNFHKWYQYSPSCSDRKWKKPLILLFPIFLIQRRSCLLSFWDSILQSLPSLLPVCWEPPWLLAWASLFQEPSSWSPCSLACPFEWMPQTQPAFFKRNHIVPLTCLIPYSLLQASPLHLKQKSRPVLGFLWPTWLSPSCVCRLLFHHPPYHTPCLRFLSVLWTLHTWASHLLMAGSFDASA